MKPGGTMSASKLSRSSTAQTLSLRSSTLKQRIITICAVLLLVRAAAGWLSYWRNWSESVEYAVRENARVSSVRTFAEIWWIWGLSNTLPISTN
ncbi:hypothetical protein BDV18DRAFT_137475 [Aspergillus unguis]